MSRRLTPAEMRARLRALTMAGRREPSSVVTVAVRWRAVVLPANGSWRMLREERRRRRVNVVRKTSQRENERKPRIEVSECEVSGWQ